MMDWTAPIIECVVNVSVARRVDIVDHITKRVQRLSALELLHIDSGMAADRTVFTIVGEVSAVFDAVRSVYEIVLSDASIFDYDGNHPTIGVVDVVPFIPIKNITVEQLIVQVENFAQEVNTDFDVPICFYGQMSTLLNQASLSQIRSGGIHSAQKRIDKGGLVLDVGENIHPALGVSCWTTRSLMLAYNVNLKTEDLLIAKKIASRLRMYRDKSILSYQVLRNVKLLGWYVQEYKRCQISVNIYDLDQCDMTNLFDIVKTVAMEFEIELDGSELIGMTSIKGLSKKATLSNYEQFVVELGLDRFSGFIPEDRILELKLKRDELL